MSRAQAFNAAPMRPLVGVTLRPVDPVPTGRRRPHRGRAVARFLCRGPARMPSQRTRIMVTLGIVAGAALVMVTGLIHLHLWSVGYRNIATIGWLFLAQSIAAMVLALLVVATRRLGATLLGAGFQVATAGGLLLSATVGLFGFHDGLDAPWAGTSLIVEGVGAGVLLMAATALAWRHRE